MDAEIVVSAQEKAHAYASGDPLDSRAVDEGGLVKEARRCPTFPETLRSGRDVATYGDKRCPFVEDDVLP